MPIHNSQIRPVVVYKTTDGQIHESKEKAQKVQDNINAVKDNINAAATQRARKGTLHAPYSDRVHTLFKESMSWKYHPQNERLFEGILKAILDQAFKDDPEIYGFLEGCVVSPQGMRTSKGELILLAAETLRSTPNTI